MDVINSMVHFQQDNSDRRVAIGSSFHFQVAVCIYRPAGVSRIATDNIFCKALEHAMLVFSILRSLRNVSVATKEILSHQSHCCLLPSERRQTPACAHGAAVEVMIKE